MIRRFIGLKPPITLYQKSLECFSTNSENKPRQQFNRFFLVKIKYNSQAYYLTYSHRNKFKQQISLLQGEQGSRGFVFGGHNFPMNGSTFVINCDTQEYVQNFVKKNAFTGLKYQAIISSSVEEMNKQSAEKMRKLWQFYQIK